MEKALKSTEQTFESSSTRTKQYLAWHRLFKKEFTVFLNARNIVTVKIGKPNHFDMSGFFLVGQQWWYFSISDLRGFKSNMLMREAKHERDFTGGANYYVSLKDTETFVRNFNHLIGPQFLQTLKV